MKTFSVLTDAMIIDQSHVHGKRLNDRDKFWEGGGRGRLRRSTRLQELRERVGLLERKKERRGSRSEVTRSCSSRIVGYF